MLRTFDLGGLRIASGIAVACVLGACARDAVMPAPVPRESAAPPVATIRARGEPFVGIEFDDTHAGVARVAGVRAGPAAAVGIARGDDIVAVDGASTDSRLLRQRLESARPGDVFALTVRRAGNSRAVTLAVGHRADWLVPSDLPSALPATAYASEETASWYDGPFARLARLAPDMHRLDEDLASMFDALAADDSGFNKLPVVRAALRAPQRLLAEEHAVMRDLQATAAGVTAPDQLFCALLAIECPAVRAADPGGGAALARIADAVAHAEAWVTRAFANVNDSRAGLSADLAYLVEQTAAGRLIHAQPDAPRALRAMRASREVRFPDLVAAMTVLLAAADSAAAPPEESGIEALPDGLVSGPIAAWTRVGDAFVVAGGSGANRYDMSRVAAVIDPGGDDVYAWAGAVPRATQLIVDVAGNDRYEADYGGPGGGWLGVSVLVDRAGDDVYRSVFGGCGAGLFGFGVLVDAGGRDVYRCDAWSVGAGMYGAGLLIDAGDGDDVYLSQILSQGVGGPRGAGLLADAAGNDLYRANGLVPSVYGTPAVFAAFSQGVGFGLRPHDHGGIGALLDGAGDDRYEGGEFSQGGGYFWGLGLLRDAAGDDLYYGNRYSQGFAAHQAVGVLTDLRGDDQYWAMTAAAQGAAWDQSTALLHDADGHDHYRAADLSQGAAAHQARAWLYDAGGDDVFWSEGARAQGAAGENTYHFDAAAATYSIGVLFDARGRDTYSSGLTDGELRTRDGDAAQGDGRTGIAFDGD